MPLAFSTTIGLSNKLSVMSVAVLLNKLYDSAASTLVSTKVGGLPFK